MQTRWNFDDIIKKNSAKSAKKLEKMKEQQEKLKDLDAKYQEVVEGASQKTLLFGDRFPFRYLVDDYGLSYYAAFVG